MDHTLWLAYCITDGEFENMNEIQKSIILRVINNMTTEQPHRKRLKTHPKSIKIMKIVKIKEKYQNNLMKR